MEGGGIRVPIKTIAKVDLKKYIQHQGVDLFWGDLIDYVQDSLFIKSDKDGTFNEKKFISKVYQLGISVRNYKYIKSRDPEIVIERFTKQEKELCRGLRIQFIHLLTINILSHMMIIFLNLQR